ncbi:MAG: 6-pyruvoyl-tetrahydropterin synthase-related protein [Patescibacteria group bacterium]
MKKVAIFLVILSAFLASRWLFKPGYFVMHDDLQMMRQLQLEKCFSDRQIPCRWVPDMGYGYGYPLFNFYPPLPYYVGQLFRWIGFSFADTAKALFSLQFFLSGITMFVLAANLWGSWGGLLSAVFYIWAPYHSVDVFVRGAMNEAWAFVWFPLIFWAAKKLVESEKTKYLVWMAFSYAMLLLSHNVMTMIFTPAMIVWIFFWMVKEEKLPWQNWPLFGKMFLSGLWAFGLAAFFTLPVFLESKNIHLETMFSGYFDWRAHFVSLNQLFVSRFWGWGPSLWGPDDGMPFPVGHLHWILALIIFIGLVFRLSKNRSGSKKARPWLVWLSIGLFSVALGYTFLAHQRSVFFWKLVEIIQISQFPWRFLAGSTFFFSLLAGAFDFLFRKRILNIFLLVLVIVSNWNFFRPEKIGPMTDAEKFSGKAWEYQRTAGLYDYLPSAVPLGPIYAPKVDWQFFPGEAAGSFEKRSNWISWQGYLSEPGTFKLSVFYFPGWRVWVDRKEAEIIVDSDSGLMTVKLDAGKHDLYFRFTNTPARSWANTISLISYLALLLFLVKGGRKWLLPR